MTPSSEVWELTLEHVSMVLIAVGIASSIGVALGILLTRRAGWRKPVLGFASLMQTVPSLALFGFLIPIPLIGGIGKRTAILALVLYALLPVLRNTLTGILGVDPAVRESAVAMGMTGRQVLWEVELPQDLPSRHPHGHGRFPHRRVDAQDAGERVAKHRQQRIQHQRENRGSFAYPA